MTLQNGKNVSIKLRRSSRAHIGRSANASHSQTGKKDQNFYGALFPMRNTQPARHS